ncbi:MAG: LPXTG cell wall anchor domain-containing protein [Lachnospiraceae bacterium]|nr:LPXTG cell wall anchor domain-containing protein [Lachnospiraceae bacterium]
MKLKDKLIRKLLDAGKKHRILVYPTLALIAVISAISHMVYWGRGNGKKLVASILVMVMLITQSVFLTSSADVVDDNPQVATSTDATGEAVNGGIATYGVTTSTPADCVVMYWRVDESGNTYPIPSSFSVVVESDGSTVTGYKVPVLDSSAIIEKMYGADNAAVQGSYITISDLYFDKECTISVGDGTITDSLEAVDGAYNVYFKATRTGYPVSITDEYGTSISSSVSASSPVTGDIYPAAEYLVPTAADYPDDLYRFGYTYYGVTLNTYLGNQFYEVGTVAVVSVDPSAQQPMDSIALTSEWKAMQFKASFYAIGDGVPSDVAIVPGESDGKLFEFTYGSEESLPNASDIWASSDAYELTGWVDEDGVTYDIGTDGAPVKVPTTGLAVEGTITDDPNITGKRLTAVWTYKKINITHNGAVTADGTSVSINSTYGENVTAQLAAQYTDGTASDFIYSMSEADKTLLGNYGLGIQSPDGQFIITGTLNNVTSSEGITVYLEVTDTKKEDDVSTAEDDRVTRHPITIVSNKRIVTIDTTTITNENGSTSIGREYNGSDIISVGERVEVVLADGSNAGKGKLPTDDVYVTVSPTAIVDPNAGDDKPITLQDVTLTGAQAGKYELIGYVDGTDSIRVDGIADITPKSLKVGIKLVDETKSTIKFGEATPEFTLYLLEPEKLTGTDKTTYDNCTTDAARMKFVADKLGYVGADTSRQLYSSTGTYTIKPEFNSTGKNYAALSDGLSLSFTVTRDPGVQYTDEGAANANFKMSTSKGSNGYYPGLTITGYGDYTKIRRIESATGDLTPSMTATEVKALFENSSITLEDMVDGTVYFQMYNPSTGAVTEIVALTNVNVDTSAPTLKTYKVTPAPNADYFKEFSFGSYYHSQKVDGVLVENVTLYFEYTTDGSDCQSLFYTFVDENGNAISDKATEVKLVKDTLSGVYSCSFTIGTGKYGQLVVYATDTTGNPSTSMKIKLKESDAEVYDPNATQSPQDYYEWMVENTLIVPDIVVMDGDQEAVTDIWYNDLKLIVEAEDLESGVDKLIWTVTGPEGYSKSYTYVAESNIASVMKEYGKILKCTFEHVLNDETLPAGSYFIEAVLEDNAGNTEKLSTVGPYLIDTKAPIITDNTDLSNAAFESSVLLDFTAVDGEGESGLSTVDLYVMSGTERVHVKSWLPSESSYTYEIISNGTYVIEAIDNAGNSSTYTMTFNNISNVAPSDPIITVDGTKGDNGWYIEVEPEVTITYEEMTSDGVEVESYYTLTAVVGNSSNTTQRVLTSANSSFYISDEGTVTIEAWSVSDSGKESGKSSAEIKVDLSAPDIQITDSVANENGDLVVSFRITDKISGVELSNVTINGESVNVTIEESALVGNFVADDSGIYILQAEDVAGNVSTYEFRPLSIDVKPITDITSSGAYLVADIYEGSYDIQDAYIAIKKDGETSYVSTLYNKTEEDYGISMNALFRNLDENSVYWYKVYAKAETSGEVKVVEGSFKTADSDATGTVSGTVVYGEDAVKEYPIYVSLYQGNTVVQTEVIEDDTNHAYQFDKVSDGAYNVVATNGTYTKTSAVTLENGGITYPTDYALNGGIHFILNNMSTSVVIEDNSINLTADALEKIYDTSWYEGNITTADKQVLANGGTIDIELHASCIDVTELSPEEQSVFDNKMDENDIIERYIQLYVVKEVRDQYGRLVNGTPTLINELYDPITVSFPLGDLAGQKIYVASVHGNGSDYNFINWDSADKVSLSNDYVTITTRYFSVYALYRTLEVPKEFTVKWIDGDGNVMKTETVVEGNSATPPTATPTKTATTKYTYTFSGWDTAYDKITQDTIIAAWFTANKIVPDEPEKEPTTEEPAPDATVTPGPTPPDDNNDDDPSKDDDKYTYMGSPDSPNTGDATPLLILLMMMIVSISGIVILRKKNNE